MVSASGGTMTIGEIPFTPRAKRVLELAVEEARSLGPQLRRHRAPAARPDPRGRGRGAPRCCSSSASTASACARRRSSCSAARRVARARPSARSGPETPALNQFGRDLTQLAREGKLDPVIGREKEIERVIQVLSRRKKNNPVLIGEPGVGKTAIAEGLAQRIVSGAGAGEPQEQAHRHARSGGGGGRHQVPRPVRGAAQDRDERDPRVEGHGDLHRRAAHHRRRGRRRGRDRRLEHAEAGAGARRAAVHRRHHARRVPQVHREGRRARAALPADHGRSAERRRTRSRS